MSKKSLILVIIQILTMVYLLIFNTPFFIGLGLVFQALGIFSGIWGILTMGIGNFNIQPEVKSNSLITAGPYNWIRNPMYLAVILFYATIVVQNFSWMNGIVFIILLITILLKIYSEEEFLDERFGEEYANYKMKSKRIIPFIY